MKNIIKLISISLLQYCLMFTVNAQDAGNYAATALKLSNTYSGGSARMMGLGGAQTALGGDISSASSNPAGLGFFNRSEFSFSPTINVINSSSSYLDNSQVLDSKLNLNFANLGIVFNKSKGDLVQSKWRGGSFAFTINRIADFQNKYSYEGASFNQKDSEGNLILDANRPKDFIEYAVLSTVLNENGEIDSDLNNPFVTLAYETFLIDAFPTDNGNIVDRDIYFSPHQYGI